MKVIAPVERRRSMREVEIELVRLREELRWTRRACVFLVVLAPLNLAQELLPYFR